MSWQHVTSARGDYILPSSINAFSTTTSTCDLCLRAPAKATKVVCGRSICYTGAQCGASPTTKGHGRAAQTRSGVTSHGQPRTATLAPALLNSSDVQ